MNYLAGYQTPDNKRYYAHNGEVAAWKETRVGAYRFRTESMASQVADDKVKTVEGFSFVVEVED